METVGHFGVGSDVPAVVPCSDSDGSYIMFDRDCFCTCESLIWFHFGNLQMCVAISDSI